MCPLRQFEFYIYCADCTLLTCGIDNLAKEGRSRTVMSVCMCLCLCFQNYWIDFIGVRYLGDLQQKLLDEFNE